MNKTELAYVFDLDGTLCSNPTDSYLDAMPIPKRIAQVNKLHEQGNSVVIYTARGMGSSGNNAVEAHNKWYTITVQQLYMWGVKYDSLVLGKPAGDVYVDDKGVSDEDYFGDKVRPQGMGI